MGSDFTLRAAAPGGWAASAPAPGQSQAIDGWTGWGDWRLLPATASQGALG